jgi:AraC-like DNA-binding protein
VLKAVWKDRTKWQLDLLVPEYLKLIESVKSEETFASKVKIAILSIAKPDLPDLNAVADNFNMTPRTLQRKLATEATSFRQIVSDLKRKISFLLIGHNRFSVAEVSDILGFSESASFIHSFRKWYGNSPERFRRQHV